MRFKLKGFITAILIFSATYLSAQNAANANGGLSRGESLFKENNAKDAVQVLEYEIMNGQVSDNSYNFLGLGYYQLGEYDKSLDAFRRGLKVQPDNKKILSYNMGNTYYALKDYTSAITAYSEAMQAEPNFYEALLNRANALLMSGQLVSAKDDYIDFIGKCPDDPQRERIELLIKALEEEIARREEEARLLAEQNKAKWEEFDGSLTEKKNDSGRPDWEEVDAGLENTRKNPDDPEWEKIHSENPGAVADNLNKQKIDDTNKDYGSEFDWEKLEHENEQSVSAVEEVVSDDEDWLTFSDAELNEMKKLEEESREEHEKWLENERRRAHELATREAQAKQKQEEQALENERRMREQLIEEMRRADEDRRKAEEERRKKLLEDVANSLQGTDSTNLTSGAEDLIEYDLEGELD